MNGVTQKERSSRRVFRDGAGVFGLLTALLLAVQGVTGTWESDLGADPDEPAHAVTALMVRDYLAGGLEGSPMGFAKRYYECFPKVALGHYPPGYYAVAGVALLPIPQVIVLNVLQAMFLAMLGVLVFAWARPWLGTWMGVGAGLVVVMLTPLFKLLVLVMADIQLAVLCLLAVWCWRRFLEAGGWRWSMGFGLLAALAILTKGSGLMLAAVPPLATLLAGQWRLILKPVWWLAGVPVLLLAAPWMVYSAPITEEGMLHQSLAEFLPNALVFYAQTLPMSFGWTVTGLLILAVVVTVRNGMRRHVLLPNEAVLWAWLIGGVALVLLVPAGLTSRYLVPLAAPVVLLGFHAAFAVVPVRWARFGGWVLLVLPVLILAETVRVPEKKVSGYGAMVRRVLAEGDAGSADMSGLVVSDARGEGGVIAAVCFQLTREERVGGGVKILRGSKELSSSDWLGRGYEAVFESETDLLKHLGELDVGWVMLDDSVPGDRRLPHQLLLEKALQTSESGWSLVRTEPVQRGDAVRHLNLYRRESGE